MRITKRAIECKLDDLVVGQGDHSVMYYKHSTPRGYRIVSVAKRRQCITGDMRIACILFNKIEEQRGSLSGIPAHFIQEVQNVPRY